MVCCFIQAVDACLRDKSLDRGVTQDVILRGPGAGPDVRAKVQGLYCHVLCVIENNVYMLCCGT